MNKLTIIGSLGSDPELKTVSTGSTVCSFPVAVNSTRKGEQVTMWFRVSAWNKLAENCAKYLARGRKVAVTGTVSARAYEAKDGSGPRASLEVMADDVEFLSSKSDSAHEPSDAAEPSVAAAAPEMDDEDLPF